MNPYKLSIVIPTKNRQRYCIEAIKQVLSNTTDRVQIVVQDNSDDESIISNFVSSLKSSRVLYSSTHEVLSFVDNFSRAVGLVDGDFVCMIGDDDGVLPNIEKAVDYCIEKEIDCLIPSQNAVYIWPTDHPIVRNAENGYLCVSGASKELRGVDCKETLKRLLQQGFQNYLRIDVPRLYHGIVRKQVLDGIKDKTGYYFGGLTPDMYMVVALSLMCRNVVASETPITIAGICPKSGSSASATGEHTGKLENAPHLVGHTNYVWSDLVPKIYTVETIWADTGMHALEDFGRKDLIDCFNYNKLLVLLQNKYPQFKQEYAEYMKSHGKPKLFSYLGYRFAGVCAFLRKAFKRVFRKKDYIKKFFNVKDIDLATTIVTDSLNIE